MEFVYSILWKRCHAEQWLMLLLYSFYSYSSSRHSYALLCGAQDMNRQVVKSDRATVTLPSLEFEIPPNTQKGVFTTIEGMLDRALENLSASQPARRAVDSASADAVEAFLGKLRALREGRAYPFTLILDDPSGNSFLENPLAPRHDPHLKATYYTRSEALNHELGCYAESAGTGMSDAEGAKVGLPAGQASSTSSTHLGSILEEEETAAATGHGSALLGSMTGADGEGENSGMVGSTAQTSAPSSSASSIFPVRHADTTGNTPSGFQKGGALITTDTARGKLTDRNRRAGVVHSGGGVESLIFDSSSSDAAKEIMRFPVDCFNCSAHGECRMCVTDVPHFKEVIIMAFTCDACGWRNVEVKGGGAVPPSGTVTELRYDPTAPDADRDMTRDVIKSDTSAIEVPEIELLLEAGSLGGMYTTVEGLLTAARDTLLESNPFSGEGGDSTDVARATVFRAFLERFNACIEGRIAFTLLMSDPMSNTWIYSPTAPDPDPRLTHTPYTRSHEEDLALGLVDMKTENYGETPVMEEEGAGSSSSTSGSAAAASV